MQKNAREYGYEERTNYAEGNCMQMPFPDASFDAVFSNGSHHKWEDPVSVFHEIDRVLRPGSVFVISDMQYSISPLLKWLIYAATKPKEIRPGFLTSLYASYTLDEMRNLLACSPLQCAIVTKDFIGLSISDGKAAS